MYNIYNKPINWVGNQAKMKTNNSILGSKRLPLIFLLTSVLFLAPFVLDDALASHLSEDTKWQLVVITSDACSNYDYQIMNKYSEITESYLGLYQFENSKYPPVCMPEDKYSSEYQPPQDLDLTILVYDRNIGEQELHSQKKGGVYSHNGIDKTQNHVIIFCDCSNFYYSNPVWILTHELSHFVLYYLNYDLSIIEDLVHVSDEKYDQCIKSFDANCRSNVMKLRTDTTAYAYSVMPIYEPAIGKEPLNVINEVNPRLLKLTKEITRWWAEDKITEGDFSNALGFILEDEDPTINRNSVFFGDGPIDKERVTWKEMLEGEVVENKEQLLSVVPNHLKSDEERMYSGEFISGLPEWFKTTATWWSQNQISNEEFQKSVKFLYNSGIIRPR